MPVELWPVMRHRMDSYRTQKHKWWGSEVSEELVKNLLAEIADRGASTARDLDDGLPRDKKHWGWNWSATKRALDYLYMTGEVAIAGRNSQFEVRYDLPERVLPADVLAAPTPTLEEANRELVRRAARSHGVATARCLADYYRMRLQPDRWQPAAGRDRGPRRRGRARAGADLGLEPAGLPPPRRAASAPRRRPGAAEPLRPGGVAARAHREALRLPLPHRDLHPGAPAHLRLLRAARSCSARRSSAGSTSRPTVSPVAWSSRRRTPSPERRRGHGRRAVRRAGPAGGLARHGRAQVEPRGDLAPLLRFLSSSSIRSDGDEEACRPSAVPDHLLVAADAQDGRRRRSCIRRSATMRAVRAIDPQQLPRCRRRWRRPGTVERRRSSTVTGANASRTHCRCMAVAAVGDHAGRRRRSPLGPASRSRWSARGARSGRSTRRHRGGDVTGRRTSLVARLHAATSTASATRPSRLPNWRSTRLHAHSRPLRDAHRA